MIDIFKQLAQTLDEMPEGFPETESGVEIKILKKIFSEDDAAMFLKLTRSPETAEQIAERLEMPAEETGNILDDMARHGQIRSNKSGGEQKYCQAAFVVGIYEMQVNRLDRELVDLFEEYLPFLQQTLGGFSPAVTRTIPIGEVVTSESSVQPYDNVLKIIEDARSFKVQECICREEQAILGDACDHTLENCISFSKEEDAWGNFKLAGRVITKENALEVLKKSAAEGLVHNLFYNVKEGYGGICNCCSCCCGILRMAKEFDAPHIVKRSNFVAVINQDDCSACGTCAEERCPMDAIIETDGHYKVQPERCIGCGVCAIACPTESITLKLRPENELTSPPDNMTDWAQQRFTHRGLR
jgi:Na+-translocating ferredoxin:NAD+ oxidoreductase subunit B